MMNDKFTTHHTGFITASVKQESTVFSRIMKNEDLLQSLTGPVSLTLLASSYCPRVSQPCITPQVSELVTNKVIKHTH